MDDNSNDTSNNDYLLWAIIIHWYAGVSTDDKEFKEFITIGLPMTAPMRSISQKLKIKFAFGILLIAWMK